MWLTALVDFLIGSGGNLIRIILTSLGIGLVSYNGVMDLLENIAFAINDNFLGLPPVVATFFKMMGLTDFIGLIIGAYSIKLLFTALSKFSILPQTGAGSS